MTFTVHVWLDDDQLEFKEVEEWRVEDGMLSLTWGDGGHIVFAEGKWNWFQSIPTEVPHAA